MVSILRKINEAAVDTPNGKSRTITAKDLHIAVMQGAGVAHPQTKKGYIEMLEAFGLIEKANKTAYYFHEEAWLSSEFFELPKVAEQIAEAVR